MAVFGKITRLHTNILFALVALTAVVLSGCGGGGVPIQNGFQNPASGSGGSGTTTNPPPPITLSLTPSSVSVQTNGVVKFSATVHGATNNGVVWFVDGVLGGNQTVGTISSSGSYQAPSTAPTPNSVIVTAASQQDPTKTAQAVVVISTATSSTHVSVSPSTITLQTGTSTVFTATVTGATSTAVTWRVDGISGGNATVGTITPAGVYTAPVAVPANSQVSITATSVSDPAASGLALANIVQRVAVQVTPSNIQVQVGLTQQFSATVTGASNTAVTWAVNGVAGGNTQNGTISPTGLYTAPGTLPAVNTVTISATSVADPTAVAFATATIVVNVGVTVSVSPVTSTLDINQTMVLVATVSGLFRGTPPSPQVTWLVNNLPGGNSTFGAIVVVPCPGPVPANSSCGQYTAPSSVPLPNTVSILANSVTDPLASGAASILITAPISVTVSIAPANAVVAVSGAQQFSASVSGTANQTVTWSVNGIVGGNATVGTISASGLYTGPASVPAGGAVLVSAASAASPTAVGSASVTIQPPAPTITVSVSPTNATLQTGNAQQFTATVTGSANQGVTWAVNNIAGGNGTVGTISAAGLYTAPASVPAGGSVLVSATSVVSASSVGSASVTVVSAPPVVSVAVAPLSAVLQTNGSQQFSATVTGTANQSVTWSVNGVTGGNAALGVITAAGLYTAPATVPAGGAVLIAATSVASPTSSGAATVTVLPAPPPVTISVNPSSITLRVNDQFAFSATVSGTSNQSVTWQVNGVTGGNATVGVISPTGIYTAPANPLASPATVTAIAAAAPNPSATASVTVQPLGSISINPTSATVAVNLGVQFNVNITGVTNTAVNFAVNGIPGGSSAVGTISNSGLYIAPATAPASPVTVTATSVADPTLVATATVTVVVPVRVTVAPTSASTTTGGTQQFTATVTGTTNLAVTWSVNGIAGGNATVGTISATGLYTAPSNLLLTQSYTISARSVADATAVGNATITVVVPVAVSVSPTSASVRAGNTLQFSSTVTGSTNTSVTWSVSANGGTISAGGLYTAPATVPAGTVTVTATSVADSTKTATATVTVQPGVSVVVNPPSASVSVGQTQQFSATVTGTTTTTVTWSVTGGGAISPAGLYTAPATIPAGAVTVTATSQDGSNTTGTATVTVTQSISVTVSPSTITLNTGQSQQFTATVAGTANQAVTWTVSGGGTINLTSGLYAAPAVPAGPITVTATSQADTTKTGTATVTVIAPPTGVFVSVFPRDKNLPIGKTQQFTAHVIRAANQSVTWSVNGVVGGNATFGTIDVAGVYSPPSLQPGSPNITVTACSTAVPTACMTVNARIVPNVAVSPASARLEVGLTQQLTATVTGTGNTAVTWSVNGVPGGNSTFGTVSASGLYTAPGTAPPGLVRISALSAADPAAVGFATLNVVIVFVRLGPAGQTVLPGGRVQFEYQSFQYPQPISTAPIVNWFVNGVQGGNATVGTISAAGLYIAPLTPQTVTIEVRSSVNATATRNVQLTVAAPTTASGVSLYAATEKLRAYDVLAAKGSSSITVRSSRNQYISWQVLVEANQEDLTGVNLTVSDLVDSAGNRIPATNAVIYLEKYVNAAYPSRETSDIGEYPDPLIPKVDPFLGQTRNAFPFAINRISPAYKIYPRSGGDTSNAGVGAGRAIAGGVFTGSRYRHFVVQIDRGGAIGTATFKWSNDGGATFAASNVPVTNSPTPLSDGVTVTFQSGGTPGVTDFNVGNTFWIYAGTLRNQPVWFDLFVPSGTTAGIYNGTVTVVRAGKANVSLAVSVDVQPYTLATSSKVPSYFGMNWTNLQNAHFFNSSGPETLGLGQLYGVACLINRINCDTASFGSPSFTFNADGTVASSNYASYDQATAPLANGSITPHGEQLAVLRLPRVGATPSEQYFATENMLSAFITRGWRSRVFDLSFDEPATSADFVGAMTRSSLVRSVDSTLRTVVTTDISSFNANLVGYVNRWSPNFATLEKKEFLDGPNSASRAFYDAAVAAGDELWWYPSCKSHDCSGTGSSPRFDNFPTFAIDVSPVANRTWGLLSISPYNVSGVLYQDTVAAYARSFAMASPRADVWESTYYNGGNGEGTLFYPGRPSDIGGANHIPVESLRLKFIRDEMIAFEMAQEIGKVNSAQVPVLIRDDLYLNSFSPFPFTAFLTNIYNAMLTQLSAPPPPPLITLPPRRGSYLDPQTGNRVYVVTDNSLCRGGAKHFYSYWPVFSSDNTHLILECLSWVGSTAASNALLLQNDPGGPNDLVVVGDALQGTSGMSPFELFWAWTNPQLVYGYANTVVRQWNPFTRQAVDLLDVSTIQAFGVTPSRMRMTYVSFDDRYFCLELMTPTFTVYALAVWDRVANQIVGLLDLRNVFYDEAIFTKGGRVWVILDPGTGLESRSYTRDFSSFVRPSSRGHHAHGLLPGGRQVTVRESSDHDCPAGSTSGYPAGQGWQPTAGVIDETINSPSIAVTTYPWAAEIFWIGCKIAGRHTFAHYSWNNVQTDRMFISSQTYGPTGTDPLADSLLRIRFQFNPTNNNQIISDQIDILATHRSEPGRFGYFAFPRMTCNQQGTRCLFASSMSVNTSSTTSNIHLYIVDVP